jgi:glycosyltransferase involved in cell wall biosynthesis
MELTVIIPTRNRCAIVRETLDRLEAQASEVDFEAIVVDDGSTDDTLEVLGRRAASSPFPLTLFEQQGLGPAAARNRAIAAARAPVSLFIDDDTWPRAGFLARHAEFHRRRPERTAALLGFTDLASDPPPTPFMEWLTVNHLNFASIEDPEDAGGRHFFSGNASVKTEFVRSVDGFDDSFKLPSHEDIDLGFRLEARGMRLVYDAEAVVEHCHPTDLNGSIARMRDVGRALAHFTERYPDHPVARRPALRHRVKAAALTSLAAAGVRTPRLQRETWRFLCHEASREGYWRAVDERDGRPWPASEHLRIGRTLARLAGRDEDAQMPGQPISRRCESLASLRS